ncbi:MAG: hypothetical protein L0Z50_33510 [Verrucomicrobiales bacterium]|nr:hypothetical protein [Verrucomicrobiales bacterium]
MNANVIKFTLPAAFIMAMAAMPGISHAGQKIDIDIDNVVFSDSLTIDNPYFPLLPGTTFTYLAQDGDECELDVFQVTNTVKIIQIPNPPGPDIVIQSREVQDDAYEDTNCNGVHDAGEPQLETTKDWHGQDDDGNVWYFGEETFECDPDCTDPAGSWEAGVDGALPGIFILAQPHPGDQHFQEIAEDEAEDQVKYLRLKVWVSLHGEQSYDDPGDFHNCWKTKEWTKLDVGHIEHKFYCPAQGAFGGGLVAVDELKGKTVRFELISVVGP